MEAQAFLRSYDSAPRPHPSAPSSVSMLDRRHKGRLRKRDNLLAGEGKWRGRTCVEIRTQESLVLCKPFNPLCQSFVTLCNDHLTSCCYIELYSDRSLNLFLHSAEIVFPTCLSLYMTVLLCSYMCFPPVVTLCSDCAARQPIVYTLQ